MSVFSFTSVFQQVPLKISALLQTSKYVPLLRIIHGFIWASMKASKGMLFWMLPPGTVLGYRPRTCGVRAGL